MSYTYELVQVRTPEAWEAYHKIREAELFQGRSGKKYNPNNPDEHLSNNFPLLLKLNGRGIGTTRLDVREDGTAVVRLVAITKNEQGKGHGRVLQERVEQLAREKGAKRLLTNAAPEAIGFYEKLGFVRDSWDPSELTGIAETCIQMSKTL